MAYPVRVEKRTKCVDRTEALEAAGSEFGREMTESMVASLEGDENGVTQERLADLLQACGWTCTPPGGWRRWRAS